MCTVTVIPLPEDGFRLVTNRDELHTRAPAGPPEARTLATGARAAWPTDPEGGGTWIGVSERGLVLALLNVNIPDAPMPGADRLSRGVLIPELLGSATARRAIEGVRERELERFRPFRIVGVDGAEVVDLRWDGARAETGVQRGHLSFFTSYGRGDHLAEPARAALFREWFSQRPATREAQDGFHRHRWPDRPEISVLMEREDARTVSTTAVEVRADGAVSLWYCDDARAHGMVLADGGSALPVSCDTR